MFVNLIRGSPKNDSIVDLDKCGASSWILLGSFIILCLLVIWYNVKVVRKELILKKKYNATCASDMDLTSNRILIKMLVFSFLAAFFGNALGLGGAFIFNPL